MRALVRGASGLCVMQQAALQPGVGEVLVTVHSCGICGSDVHMADAGLGQPGGIPGHEFSGTISALGEDVVGWQVGQPVAVNPLAGCGECEFCARDTLILCRNRPNLGLNAPGGFAEQVVAHQSQLFALPASMQLELGSRVEPLAVAIRAVAEAQPAPGDNALVLGVGPIGLCVILALRAAGAGTIVAVGRSSAGRRAAASAMGADVVLDSREVEPAEYVREKNLSISQAYECSADPRGLDMCGAALKPCGTIVGLALGNQPSSLDTHRFVGRGLRLLSGCAYGNADFARALDLIASSKVDVVPLISERVPLEQAPEMLVRLQHPGDLVSVLVQPWRTAVQSEV
jgi:threonine dehydrogenase-like Zn-dependent dehydrogenase